MVPLEQHSNSIHLPKAVPLSSSTVESMDWEAHSHLQFGEWKMASPSPLLHQLETLQETIKTGLSYFHSNIESLIMFSILKRPNNKICGVYYYWFCLICDDFRYFPNQYSKVSQFINYEGYFYIKKFIHFYSPFSLVYACLYNLFFNFYLSFFYFPLSPHPPTV